MSEGSDSTDHDARALAGNKLALSRRGGQARPMGEHGDDARRGYRALLTGAAIIVVIWGLRWSAPILLPILSAGFLATLCIPPMRRLERHGAPTWLALLLVLAAANAALLVVAAVVGNSVLKFQSQVGLYRERLDSMLGQSIEWLNSLGANLSRDELLEKFDTAAVMEFAGNTAQSLVSAASDGFLVGLTVIFILFEASDFPAKLRHARAVGTGEKRDPDDLSSFTRAATAIHDYLAIKTLVSAITGTCAALLTWAIGVDFPLLWGLLAFLFNYIPNIGSIIAAVPAVLLALLQLGPGHAAGVAIGYLVINLILGNAVEPRLLGNRLGLSTLVVWVSLIFWNWVWGPVGMLLSVPLTVIVKILFEHTDDLKAVAVLLGPSSAAE